MRWPISSVRSKHRPAGFTLIELLIVVIIIGILIGIGVPAYLTYQAKAKDRDAQNALWTAFKAAHAGGVADTGKYGKTTSIVSDIVADEPGFSVASGDCGSGVVLAPAKQVIVSTSTTASQLVLCTRSQTGVIFQLSGTTSGTASLGDGSTLMLNVSPADVSDASRALAVDGDGRAADSSFGVFQATTNLALNGSVETNSGDWGASGLNTPLATTAAVGAGTGLTGTFVYRESVTIGGVETNAPAGQYQSSPVTVANQNIVVTLGRAQNGDPGIGRKLYRSSDGGTTWKLAATIPDGTATTTYNDSTPDASLPTVTPPTGNPGLATLTRTTSTAKFRSYSMQVSTPGVVGAEGAFVYTMNNLNRPAGTSVSAGGWVKGTPGVQLAVWTRIENTDATISDSAHSAYTLNGSWQYLTAPAFSVQPGKTGDEYQVMFRTVSTVATTFYLDGVQIEAIPINTPFVETNGTAQSRAAGSVSIPASFVTESQGWVALRVRLEWANGTVLYPTVQTRFFGLGTLATPGRILGLYDPVGNVFRIYREKNSIVGTADVGGGTFSAGTMKTLVFVWTPTQVKASVDGSPFTTVADTNVPFTGASTLYLGADAGNGGQYECDCEILWAATGTGTLSDSDAAAINGFGDTDHPRSDFPGQATLAWSADTATGSLK